MIFDPVLGFLPTIRHCREWFLTISCLLTINCRGPNYLHFCVSGYRECAHCVWLEI